LWLFINWICCHVCLWLFSTFWKKNENQYRKKINDTDILIFFAIVFCFILCKIYFILCKNLLHFMQKFSVLKWCQIATIWQEKCSLGNEPFA
jgi:prolipoprotein diacylglyceryltransferase